MKYSYLILIFFAFAKAYSQQLTGPQLLEKAIAYHDPEGNWPKFIGNLEILTTIPEGEDRTNYLDINLPAKSFELISKRGDLINEYRVFKDSATVAKLDLSKPDSIIATTNEDFERAVFMRNYYTYLYGLPMKLKDPGTIVSYEVQNKKLNKKDYLVLQVNYKVGVGSDVWFFYFDPVTYRMEAYQFYKEKENRQPDLSTGEYILLSSEYKTNGILMPKVRKWYYNKDKKYLATDTLVD
jgi:hypothetical protein